MNLPNQNQQRLLRLKREILEETSNLRTLEKEMEGLQASLALAYPSTYDLRAAGSILHDFYRGIETVFRRIAYELNGGLPAGEDWHKQLLIDMSLEIDEVRPAVISKTLREHLDEYLGFRHVFRNVYGFLLIKDRIITLSTDLPRVLDQVEKELSYFCDYLETLSQRL